MGALAFRLMIRPVLGASDHTMVVICIGFFVGFEAICLWFWGADPRAFPRIFPGPRLDHRRRAAHREQSRHPGDAVHADRGA